MSFQYLPSTPRLVMNRSIHNKHTRTQSNGDGNEFIDLYSVPSLMGQGKQLTQHWGKDSTFEQIIPQMFQMMKNMESNMQKIEQENTYLKETQLKITREFDKLSFGEKQKQDPLFFVQQFGQQLQCLENALADVVNIIEMTIFKNEGKLIQTPQTPQKLKDLTAFERNENEVLDGVRFSKVLKKIEYLKLQCSKMIGIFDRDDRFRPFSSNNIRSFELDSPGQEAFKKTSNFLTPPQTHCDSKESVTSDRRSILRNTFGFAKKLKRIETDNFKISRQSDFMSPTLVRSNQIFTKQPPSKIPYKKKLCLKEGETEFTFNSDNKPVVQLQGQIGPENCDILQESRRKVNQ